MARVGSTQRGQGGCSCGKVAAEVEQLGAVITRRVRSRAAALFQVGPKAIGAVQVAEAQAALGDQHQGRLGPRPALRGFDYRLQGGASSLCVVL